MIDDARAQTHPRRAMSHEPLPLLSLLAVLHIPSSLSPQPRLTTHRPPAPLQPWCVFHPWPSFPHQKQWLADLSVEVLPSCKASLNWYVPVCARDPARLAPRLHTPARLASAGYPRGARSFS